MRRKSKEGGTEREKTEGTQPKADKSKSLKNEKGCTNNPAWEGEEDFVGRQVLRLGLNKVKAVMKRRQSHIRQLYQSEGISGREGRKRLIGVQRGEGSAVKRGVGGPLSHSGSFRSRQENYKLIGRKKLEKTLFQPFTNAPMHFYTKKGTGYCYVGKENRYNKRKKSRYWRLHSISK